jgi:hypothetical protein
VCEKLPLAILTRAYLCYRAWSFDALTKIVHFLEPAEAASLRYDEAPDEDHAPGDENGFTGKSLTTINSSQETNRNESR